MDDINNKTAVDNQVVNLSQPVGQNQDQKPAPVVPSSAVSFSQKEQAPISPTVQSEISEIIAASEKEPRVPEEVRKAGVEKVSDRFPLTKEHTDVGIQHAGESTPVDTQPKLPMTDKEAMQIIKTVKPDNSIFGLAILVLKYVKRTMLGE